MNEVRAPRIRVAICPSPGHDAAVPLPAQATPGAAGLDLHACLAEPDRASGLAIAPGAWLRVPTALAVAIPPGYEIQIRPRSGLAWRHGVTLLNAPGTIDADYRGEIGVLLVNHGSDPFVVEHAMRIAQMVPAPVVGLDWTAVETLAPTRRGTGGFGSTGTGGAESTGTGGAQSTGSGTAPANRA